MQSVDDPFEGLPLAVRMPRIELTVCVVGGID